MITQHPNAVWLGSVVGLAVVIGILVVSVPSPTDVTAPSVGISYPDEGAMLRGQVDIGVYASDERGIDRVELTLDCTRPIARFMTPPYTAQWDTTALAPGRYRLCVTAWDRAGLTSRVTREVTVGR